MEAAFGDVKPFLTKCEYSDILTSMNYIQRISKIRERGQFTVPQEVRKVLQWPNEEIPVKVETTGSGFKVERLPISHPQNSRKRITKIQAEKIWADMKRISKKMHGVNLNNILSQDRNTHF